MQYGDKILCGSCLLGIHSGILIEDVKTNLALENLDQQTVHRTATGSDLLEHILAISLLLDLFPDALQLSVNSVYPYQQLLLLVGGVGQSTCLLDILYRG